MAPSQIHAVFSLYRRFFSDIGLCFQRVRRWTPEKVALGLVMLMSQPGIHSIEKLMKDWATSFQLPTVPSDSTFVEARKKLAEQFPKAMSELWQRLVSHARDLIPVSRRKIGELQVIAVDGTWAWAPHEAGIIKRWGRPKTGNGGKLHYPQLLLITALDVLTRIPLAATVMGHGEKGGERAGVRSFLGIFGPGTVVLADRGFPAKYLLHALVERGAHLLWRMQSSDAVSWDCVHQFLHDPAKPREQKVKISLKPHEAKAEKSVEIEVRLIRRVFKRGRPKSGQKRDVLVLMTTLMDDKVWPAERLLKMYERRWVIESWFKDLKINFGIEAFHSRRDDLMLQEIHALLSWMTLCSILERDAYQRIERSRGKQDPEDPCRFQISYSNLYYAASQIFTKLMINQDVEAVLLESERDLHWLDSTARRRRPGRSYKRVNNGPFGRW